MRIATIAAMCLLAACAAGAAGGRARRDCRRQARAADVDDAALVEKLKAGAAELLKAGKTVKTDTLLQQLERGPVGLALPAAPPTPPSGAPQIYDAARAGVVILASIGKCDECEEWHEATGAGIVLTEEGHVLTCRHVLDDPEAEAFVAMIEDGRIVPVGEVVAATAKDDLAVVKLALPEGARLKPLPLGTEPPIGATIYVLSHPDARFWSLTNGIVSRYSLEEGDDGRTRWMAVTAEIAGGSSGGPVLDSAGRVVAVVSTTQSVYSVPKEDGDTEDLQMVFRFCTPVGAVRKLLTKP